MLFVQNIFGDKYNEKLLSHGISSMLVSFPSGELYKTRTTKEFLENQLLERGIQRNATLIALGGGVTTDLVGFIASTYHRGIPFISIPTTVVGMADASIGGKTGVNAPQGKNLIGSLYLPTEIIIDVATLNTLSQKEMRQGAVEMVKHALLFSEEYFFQLEGGVEGFQSKDSSFLQNIISRSIAIKHTIVEMDPYEEGVRKALNFGHTLGHALEAATDYTLSHGEAVAWGMVWEAEVSVRLQRFSREEKERLIHVLLDYGLLSSSPLFHRENFFDALTYDKKSVGKGVPIVLLSGIGGITKEEDLHLFHADPLMIQEVVEEQEHHVASALH